MADVFFINDFDPETELAFKVTGVRNHLAGSDREYGTTVVPGALGSVLSPTVTAPAKTLTINGRALLGSLTAREAWLNKANRYLQGRLEIRFVDQPDKVQDAYLAQLSADAENPRSFVDGTLNVRMVFQCPNPWKRDRYGQVLTFGSTRTEVPLGDLPSGGVLKVMGTASNPTIRYRGASGEVLESIVMGAAPGTTGCYNFDLDARILTKNVAGTVTNANSDFPTGYYWFNPDPADGREDWGGGPTLETTQGTGVYLYHRRWNT